MTLKSFQNFIPVKVWKLSVIDALTHGESLILSRVTF